MSTPRLTGMTPGRAKGLVCRLPVFSGSLMLHCPGETICWSASVLASSDHLYTTLITGSRLPSVHDKSYLNTPEAHWRPHAVLLCCSDLISDLWLSLCFVHNWAMELDDLTRGQRGHTYFNECCFTGVQSTWTCFQIWEHHEIPWPMKAQLLSKLSSKADKLSLESYLILKKNIALNNGSNIVHFLS